MGLQYISDSKGKTTGVFIPIEEWKALKSKFQGLEEVTGVIPDWQKAVVRERMKKYEANPTGLVDFEKGIEDIDKSL